MYALYQMYVMGYAAGFETCSDHCANIMKEHMEQYHPLYPLEPNVEPDAT